MLTRCHVTATPAPSPMCRTHVPPQAEKFTRWDDKETGINPFTPQLYKGPRKGVAWLMRELLGLVLAMLRLPIALVLMLVIALLSVVLLLLPVPPIRRLLRLFIEAPLCRALLVMFGFYNAEETTAEARRLRLRRVPAGSRGADDNAVHSGDIIFANHMSFIDVLYLNAKHAPIFGVPTLRGGVSSAGVLGALAASVGLCKDGDADTAAEVTAATVASAQGLWAGPLAVFPEAARTNGRAVLEFAPGIGHIEAAVTALPAAKRPRTRVYAIQYSFTRWCPAHTCGNWLRHAYNLCTQVYNVIKVTHLPPGYDPQPGVKLTGADAAAAAAAAAGAASGDGTPLPPSWSAAVRESMSVMLALKKKDTKKVALGAADFAEFQRCYADPQGYKPRDE